MPETVSLITNRSISVIGERSEAVEVVTIQVLSKVLKIVIYVLLLVL